MSIKTQAFVGIVSNPLNTHNFLVSVPGANLSEIVESTSVPSDRLQAVTLWYQGERIQFPTIPQNGGTWAFRIPEADNGAIRRQFDEIRNQMYNSRTGILIPQLWKNVQIFQRDLQDNNVFSCTLHGCWLMGKNDVAVQNSNPTQSWKWDYQWVYQWIEYTDFKNKGSQSPIQ